jgi:hypothetical protein
MAHLRARIRDKLDCYLRGALAVERLIEQVATSDEEFRRALAEDEFMDVDEGNKEFSQSSEFSQSLIDAIWLHRYKLDDSEVSVFY